MLVHALKIAALGALLFNTCTAQSVNVQNRKGTISPISQPGKAIAAHTATLLRDGTVLIAGGMEHDGELYDDAALFVPASGKFKKIDARMSKKRVSHTATLLADGRVLIAGGWSTGSAPERSAEIFDPSNGKFSPAGDQMSRRSGHSATLLKNGEVLLAGGSDGDRNLDSAELFDPATNTFSAAPSLSSPRNMHSAVALHGGEILLTGGEIRRGEVSATAEIYQPDKEKFETVKNSLGTARYKHDSIVMKDGRVLIIGGSDQRDLRGRLKSAEIFDPKSRTFEKTGDMTFPRFKIGASSALLKNGNVLVAGGGENAEIFDPKSGTFSLVESAIGKSLHYSSATVLTDGRVLIIGGYAFFDGGEPTGADAAWLFEI